MVLLPDASYPVVADIRANLITDDAQAEVAIRAAPRGSLPIYVGAAVAGTAAATFLARRVVDVVCRFRKRGTVIDTRIVPLHIFEASEVPGGFILIIHPDGTSVTHDACTGGFDL